MQTEVLEGGFADAPVEAAHAFRALLSALSRPGQVVELAGAAPPAPVSPAAGTLLLTLADAETPVHLAGAHDTEEVRAWLAFHTGAPVAGRESAVFAIGTWEALLPLRDYRVGTPDYPDRSATLIVERMEAGGAGAVLTGPGIDGHAQMDLPALEPFRENAARFPLGLDFFFASGARVAALPRSTHVEAR